MVSTRWTAGVGCWNGMAYRRTAARCGSAARSLHPGGANVLLADGSVRFIKNTVGLAPWRALGTRAGGEVLSADQY